MFSFIRNFQGKCISGLLCLQTNKSCGCFSVLSTGKASKEEIILSTRCWDVFSQFCLFLSVAPIRKLVQTAAMKCPGHIESSLLAFFFLENAFAREASIWKVPVFQNSTVMVSSLSSLEFPKEPCKDAVLIMPSDSPECKSHPSWARLKEWRGRRVCIYPILYFIDALYKPRALHFSLAQSEK